MEEWTAPLRRRSKLRPQELRVERIHERNACEPCYRSAKASRSVRSETVALQRPIEGEALAEPLFETQRIDRIERRRFPRRIEAEEHTGHRRKAEGDRDGVGRDGRRPALPQRDALSHAEAERDADAAAEEAEHDRLDEELQEHITAARPDRHAQTDLARPLG